MSAEHGATLRLEELTLNTAPAVHQVFYDGWVLRASGSEVRRANSVTALGPSTLPPEQKILHCEDWYRRMGQPAIFRLTEAYMPAEMDELLAARGYTREVETYMMTAPMENRVVQPLPDGVRLVERPETEGVADLHRMKGSTPEGMQAELRRQALWRGEQHHLSLKTINGVVATGMARQDGEHVGIFSMYTAGNARGKGYASLLVGHLLAWGAARGAKAAFLQVDRSNEAAISVYRKFGFAPRYTYWHRVQGAGAGMV